jgi:hypothetical protein
MIEHVLHPRITENKDWATVLFVLAFANSYHKVSMKIVLVNLIFSDKYSKVYRDSSQLKVVLPSIVHNPNYFCGFFIQLSLSILVMQQKQIGFFLSKFLLF